MALIALEAEHCLLPAGMLTGFSWFPPTRIGNAQSKSGISDRAYWPPGLIGLAGADRSSRTLAACSPTGSGLGISLLKMPESQEAG